MEEEEEEEEEEEVEVEEVEDQCCVLNPTTSTMVMLTGPAWRWGQPQTTHVTPATL